MALAYRAARTSTFDIKNRGKSPAPGTYNITESNRPQSVPYVGFSSTGQRSQLTRSDATTTPGPGEHQTTQLKKQPSLNPGSNNFKSKQSRFAPFAPGSTVFRPSSVLDNPGPKYDVRKPLPGTEIIQDTTPNYTTDRLNLGIPEHKQDREQRQQRQQRQRARTMSRTGPSIQEMISKRHTPVPTIPIRRQSHGYDQSQTGKLLPQPAPIKEYAGIGMDTVGPAGYHVRQDPTKSGAPRVNFARSSKRPEIFSGPSATKHVGPGSHNIAGARFVDRSKRGTAAFNSKVPMAQDREEINVGGSEVGPGAYTLPSTLRGGLLDSEGTNVLSDGLATHVQRFGSTENRTGTLTRDLHAPYTNRKTESMPGPGAYGEKRTSFRTKIQKKLTDEVIGFGATDTRPCLKNSKIKDVGVDYYSDPNALAVAVGRKTVGRNGVFGTTEQRFNRGIFSSPKAGEVAPGPGQYTIEGIGGSNSNGNGNGGDARFPSERIETTAAFRSGARRFGGHAMGSRKAMLEMQHAQEHAHKQRANATASSNNMSSWGTFGGKGKKRNNYPESIYSDRSKQKGSGFTSTSGRFGTKGERAGLFGEDAGGPGPGGYTTTMKRSISNVRRRQHSQQKGTLGGSQRFSRRRNKSSASLGPGHGSMMRKTFNITYSMK
tara:strand:+ start:186 stop:2156 length:1971 start_codon:yes stop_codon:yes gene_type:complete